jgi:predicted RNase H-like HicB family nuclease
VNEVGFHKLRVILEPGEEGGFTTFVPAVPGCISKGNDREETSRQIGERLLFPSEVRTNSSMEEMPL